MECIQFRNFGFSDTREFEEFFKGESVMVELSKSGPGGAACRLKGIELNLGDYICRDDQGCYSAMAFDEAKTKIRLPKFRKLRKGLEIFTDNKE